jgi:septal ring factor EnvC (AmiA/AmiB activator)
MPISQWRFISPEMARQKAIGSRHWKPTSPRLKEVVANAKAEIEQTRQKADALSRQVAGQSAANDKLQAELDNLRAGINAYWQQVVRNLCS